MKFLLTFVIIMLASCATKVANSAATDEIREFLAALNALYNNADTSPLRGKYFENFTVHPFFPIDLKYRVAANFEKISDANPFEMPTSSGKTKTYKPYARATFTIDGKSYSLVIYQSEYLKTQEEYRNHLFLPFYDLTNGDETYGGGRYIDLEIPESSKIIIDFNQAYQPYCAYNLYDYSCPIVPTENRLDTKIMAGVKYNADEFEH